MIVAPNRAQPELTFVLLTERELEALRELLRKPKGSPHERAFATDLRSALKSVRRW